MPRAGRREKKINIIAGYCNGKLIAPTKYSWNTNAAFFLTWLEYFLIPYLQTGAVLIMDNASFHIKADIRRIATFYGHSVLFLPPYSPDKNPIEKKWANIKNWLRIYSKIYSCIREAIEVCFITE